MRRPFQMQLIFWNRIVGESNYQMFRQKKPPRESTYTRQSFPKVEQWLRAPDSGTPRYPAALVVINGKPVVRHNAWQTGSSGMRKPRCENWFQYEMGAAFLRGNNRVIGAG